MPGHVLDFKLTFHSFYGHFLQFQDILVGKHLKELDLSERSNWELAKYQVSMALSLCMPRVKRTPSFSLCIRIFFSATIASVFRDRALWTSLDIRISIVKYCKGPMNEPKCTLSQFTHHLIILDLRTSVECPVDIRRGRTRSLRHCDYHATDDKGVVLELLKYRPRLEDR